MARLEGNVYVDPAYTSQEAIDALGGTSSITGETLTYNYNAFASGGTTSNVPAIGGTIFFNNLDRLGESIYNDGTYDMVLINTRSNYLYVVPKEANKTYSRDMNVYVEGGTHQHLALLGRSGNVKLMGNLTFTAKNVHFGTQNDNMGGGDSNDSDCVILGDITFSLSDCTTGGSFYVHCGDVGSVDQSVKVTGTVTNFLSTSAFRGIRTGDGRAVYADFDLVVTGSSFSNSLELGYATNNSTWEGTFTMTVTASTAANIFGFERATSVEGDNEFILNVEASEIATRTGIIYNFTTVNIASGATLIVNGMDNTPELNIELGSTFVTQNLNTVEVINVIGDLTQNDTVIISGLTVSEIDAEVYVGDVRYEAGKFPGFYEIVGGDLIIHNATSTVLLVNSNYTDGEKTELGPKGYSTIAAAQAAVTDKATTTIMVYAMDDEVEPNVFTADAVTKDYTTSFVGEDGETVSLDGFDIVIGDEAAAVDSANVSISYTDNINAVRFGGNVAGTAKVAIDHAGDDEETALGTLDLSGVAVGTAAISVDESVIGDVKLADSAGFFGSVTIKNSTITNVYGGAGAYVTNDLTGGNEIENVFAEGNGANIKLGTSTKVGTYMAGLSTEGGELDFLDYNDAITADTIIVGGNSNTINGAINASFTGGSAKEVKIGGEGDTITGDVDVTFTGGMFEQVVIGDGVDSIGGNVTVTLAGGTTDVRSNGTFYGLVYGASITDVLDGGEEGMAHVLFVEGNAKVDSIKNFNLLSVTGGTLNVASGTDKSEVSASNSIEINGDIMNRRGINAGVITATNNLINYGVIGTTRAADVVGITLGGNFDNFDYVMTSAMEIAGDFYNTGKVTATGDIYVGGAFENTGDLFFKATSSQDGTFTQNGGLELNGVDLVNTGFISAGSLTGVKNLTTSKLYVTGGAEIDGNITIEAGAEVAFTNKANEQVENGLTLSGSIYMADTSRLVVSGELDTTGTKTITVNVGDLIGSQEIVRAESGVNSWTVKLEGANKSLYEVAKTDTSVVIYSLDKLFVNSKFSADQKIVVDGNTLVFGKNAFASVADAVAAAKSGARIVVVNDNTGMDVVSANYDVELVNSVVGDVTAKNLFVTSDSTANSIVSAAALTIDASAVLTVADTISSSTAIKIDASAGTGSRLVLDVDPDKVPINAANVTIIAPDGKTYTAMVLSADPEAETAPAHVGDLYILSDDYVYFRKGNPAFVDGDTFDAATGDALFAGVNVFDTREAAESVAGEAGGVLVLVGFTTSDKQKGSSTVNTAFEFAPGGSSGLYGTAGEYYEGDDHTTLMLGSTVGTTVYGLNKAFNTNGNYTLIVKDSVFYGNNFYITGNTYGSVINGNIKAEIIGSTIAGPSGTNNYSAYIGYGNFGTYENAPIDIDVTIKDSRLGAFRGINMSGSTATQINANIDITVLDSTVGGHFYVINTADWVANSGANIYQSTYTAGSITVTMGGSSVTNTLRPGDSLTHGANALQVFNAPTTLHIVATDKSAVTRADWVMEWDTIIIDADARLELGHNLQFQTAYRGEGNDVMDGAGTTIQILVNMSGYEGGTHTVIVSGLANDGVQNQIYVNEDLSNIAVIGDNDLTGQCQLVYSGFRQQDAHWALRRIAVFDKTDDMYVNASYNDDISGTTIGGQELFFGANAHTDFTLAVEYASEWGGTIVVTGGKFDAQDFEGNNVDFQNGTIEEITMGDAKASTLKVGADARFDIADGSGVATMEIADTAVLGDVEDFATIKFGAGATITAATLDLSDSSVVIDVDGYTGSSHIVLSTTDGITGFDASKFSFVGENADKYSVFQDGNDIVLKTSIQSNVYVNSEYTAEITGTIMPDGTYLEYGFNAFSVFAEGAAAIGGASNTLTVTGGTFTDDFNMTTGNLVIADGVVTSGMVIGNGKTVLTVSDTATVGGIEGVSRINLTTNSYLDAGYISLNKGTIYVPGSAVASKSGNLTKIVSTQAGISGVTLEGDPGFYVYGQGNDVYLLDLTRIYVDPNYTEAVTGTTAFTGDTLVWGVNAFRVASNTNLANAADVNNALVSGGTLFVLNWGTAGTQSGDIRPLKDVSIYAQGPTNFSIVFGNNGGNGHVVDGDVTITVDNTSTPQASTAFIHSGDNNVRWTFNGNVTVNFVGEGQVNTNTAFAVTKRVKLGSDATLTLNIDGKRIENDVTFFRQVANGDFNDAKKITINFNNVYGPNDKWIRLFSNNDNTDGSFGNTDLTIKDVEMNITNSWFRSDNNQNWSISLVNGNAGSRNTNFTIHLSGATVDGLISGVRNRAQDSPGNGSVYNGTRTVYVDGGTLNRLARLIEINHLVVDANTSLVLTDRQGRYGNNVPYALHFLESNSSGTNSITVDVTDYNGEDKMIVSAPRMGIAQRGLSLGDVDLVLKGDADEKFILGLGLTHGVYIITKNGDVMYNADFTVDDNGTAVGSTFVHIDEDEEANSNAFNEYDKAKAAIDARVALGLDRKLYVSGIGDDDEFYADGYAVTITGGLYQEVYGTDDKESSVASVDITITGGTFLDTIAVADSDAEVTGDARIELIGGTFGTPAVYSQPTDPEEEPEIEEDEVPVTISGSKDSVGGTSTLVVSSNLKITGDIVEFDNVFVNANLSVTGDFEADVITIDASKKLTVGGDVEATTIVIDAQAYEGPTKAIAVAGNFENEQPAVSIIGDLETYDYRYVEDTLYLVSKNAGNVYLNADWDESISGTIYNGELLVFGVNAFNAMDEAILKTTSDYTMYVLGGVFNEVYDLTGIGQVNLNITGGTFGGFIVGDGADANHRSTIRINEGTVSNAVSIGSLTGVEGSTIGYRVIAAKDTAFGTIDGLRYFRFGAGQNVTVNGISFIEIAGATEGLMSAGEIVIDLAGYTAGSGVLLQTVDGIANYLVPTEFLADGTPVCRVVIGVQNNGDMLMPYYDDNTKAIIAVERGEFAYLDANASAEQNGTVVTIDGKSATQVYGYNLSNWNVNAGRYAITGGTLFADGGEETAFYWFFTAAPINVNVKNLRTGGFVAGYNDDSAADQKYREGDFTAVIDATTITWFAAIAGQGNDGAHQEMVVAKYNEEEEEYEDVAWNITISNGTHDMNDFRVARYANLSGGTVNVTFADYSLRGDLHLFNRIFNGKAEGHEGDELKEVNIVMTNVQSPASKWLRFWGHQENNSTKINITITDSNFVGNDYTFGIFDDDLGGTWNGQADVYISGMTMAGGRLAGDRGSAGGGTNNIAGTRTLHVTGGTNNVALVRQFNTVEIADGAMLTGQTISMVEGGNFILRGEEGYTGEVKEYAVVGTTILGAAIDAAEFVDEEGYEIDGYKAAVGGKSVFIYKTDGDVYYSNEYAATVTGTAITEEDGTKNFLVYGDNAVDSMKAAYDSVDGREGKATIQVMNAMAQYLYTNGYTTVVNGGQITNVVGGTNGTEAAPADDVDSVDITIKSGATVTNVVVATEFSQVDDDALITVADGVTFTGTLDGATDFVGGDSTLVFEGSASAKAITGFDNVVLTADGKVELSGAFTGDVITIDASEFIGSTKKVLVANGGFGEDVSAITVLVTDGFGYQFLDDGKTLVVTSPLVNDTFANTSWTEESIHNQFVGDTALVWGVNAFNSFATAAGALGQDGTLTLDGGASTDDIVLTKSNDVVVNDVTSVNSITADGGVLTVANDFSAANLSGFSALNFKAGNDFTVSGGISMAANSTITIDVTGFKQDDVDVVVLSTETGIENIDTATLTVTGETDKVLYAYYDSVGGDVHLMRIDNFYVDVAYGTAGENILPGQTNPITGEHLIFGVNAFYYLNDGLNAMKPGQCLYINNRNANIATGDRMGNIYITNSTVPVLINGYTTGDQVYVGDVWLNVENSAICTTGTNSYLFGNVTVGEAWNHNQHILGNMTVNVIGSSIGTTDQANMVTGINYVNVLGTAEEMATITFNVVDTVIYDDILFIGDSPIGKDETFQGVTHKGANLVINLENVVTPRDKWWRIQGGDQQSEGTVTVNLTGSTFGDNRHGMRFALDDNWGTGWGSTPRSHSDFVFNVTNTQFNGTLAAGRLNLDELPTTYDGAKVVNLVGDNYIYNTYWFKEINLAAGATLTGNTLRMATVGSPKINIDITGYTGKSKIIVKMNNAFENITAADIVVTMDAESEYEVLTSDRAVVIKGALKDMYVNNTYTAQTCPVGTAYNDDLLFFGENAFATITEAIPNLTYGAVLYVTGGEENILETAFLANSITIDASADLFYSGSDAVVISGDLVNAGTFTISAAGFVGEAPEDVIVLTATSITGDGTFATDDAAYMVKLLNGNEVHLVMKKVDVYVNTEWAELEDGAEVMVGNVTATIGIDAFATADAAASAVSANGTITIIAGDVSFSGTIVSTVFAQDSVTIQKAAVGSGSAFGALTLQAGSVASNVSVRSKGTLTVEAGAKVTGGLGMLTGAAVSFAAGSVLDFDISGTTAGSAASVTNFSILTGAPTYTVTLAAAQAEGDYLLASDAASFTGSVTLMVGESSIGSVALGSTYAAGGFVYTLGLTDNNELALTIEEGALPDVPTLAYVNSEWAGLEDGTPVAVGDIMATIGYNAFADLWEGINGVTEDGSVNVFGGEVSFANGYYKTITVGADATVVGQASFLNRPITINGTMAFDVALTTRTSAQFDDIQFVSGDTQYTLTVQNPAVGVYMLASGLWYDALYQPVFNGEVQFLDTVLTVGNDVTIGEFTYGLRTTSNLELMLTIEKAVAPVSNATILSACINGEDNMIGRMSDSETAGFATDTQFYWSTGDAYGAVYSIEDGWVFAGIGDFNGDGKDDMLRYCAEGDAKGYVVADLSVGGGLFTPTVVNIKNASWDILGTGDFNGDGFDDVLVANPTAASATIGLLGYWSKGTDWTLINGYSDEWTLVDTGDYDGNGCCDMLWKNSFVGDGGLTYNAYCTWRLGDIEGYDWSIVMVTKVNETEEKDSDAWSFVGTGDFNNDGVDDIVMKNDFGVIAINTMSESGTPTNWVIYNQIADDVTRVATITDIDGNGCADIILAGLEDPTYGTQISYWSTGVDELNRPVCDGWTYVGYLA